MPQPQVSQQHLVLSWRWSPIPCRHAATGCTPQADASPTVPGVRKKPCHTMYELPRSERPLAHGVWIWRNHTSHLQRSALSAASSSYTLDKQETGLVKRSPVARELQRHRPARQRNIEMNKAVSATECFGVQHRGAVCTKSVGERGAQLLQHSKVPPATLGRDSSPLSGHDA